MNRLKSTSITHTDVLLDFYRSKFYICVYRVNINEIIVPHLLPNHQSLFRVCAFNRQILSSMFEISINYRWSISRRSKRVLWLCKQIKERRKNTFDYYRYLQYRFHPLVLTYVFDHYHSMWKAF